MALPTLMAALHEDRRQLVAVLDLLAVTSEPETRADLAGELVRLSARYEDAIPNSYVTSLDSTFHRGYQNPVEVKNVARFMVDYLFLSKKYAASGVRLQFGLSDHAAIVASIDVRNLGIIKE